MDSLHYVSADFLWWLPLAAPRTNADLFEFEPHLSLAQGYHSCRSAPTLHTRGVGGPFSYTMIKAQPRWDSEPMTSFCQRCCWLLYREDSPGATRGGTRTPTDLLLSEGLMVTTKLSQR